MNSRAGGTADEVQQTPRRRMVHDPRVCEGHT